MSDQSAVDQSTVDQSTVDQNVVEPVGEPELVPYGATPNPATPPERYAAPSRTAGLSLWQSVTPLGRTAGAVAFVSFVLAVWLGWVELAVIAVACGLSLLIGVAFLLAGQTNLRVLLELGVKRVVAGSPASTHVEATNDAGRRALPIRLEARVGKGVAHMNVPALASGQSFDQMFVIPTKRRSVVPVGPVRSVQGDPLGLVRREITWTGTEELYVHPKMVHVGALTTGWMRDLEGQTTNDRSPSDVAFHTLREYVVGDDRRHIHWRTTARQPDGKLMVREFVDTRRAHLGMLLSVRPADYASADEFELAVSALASLGVRAIGDEQDVTCLVGNRLVPTFHGASFLDSLARIEMGDDESDIVTIASRSKDLLAAASVIVLIGGSATDLESMRAAAERVGAAPQAIVVTANLDSESTLHPGSDSPIISLGQLDELPRLIWMVTTL